LQLENFQPSFSSNLDEPEGQVTRSDNKSNSRARRVKCAFTISILMRIEYLETNVDYASKDDYVMGTYKYDIL
jgi:hypothetical protein